jgi:hypothetical protein
MTLDVEDSETILSIKERIYEREGIRPDKQRLCFDSQLLDNSKTVSDYNMVKESNLYLQLPMRESDTAP